jgi:hypothetical protein
MEGENGAWWSGVVEGGSDGRWADKDDRRYILLAQLMKNRYLLRNHIAYPNRKVEPIATLDHVTSLVSCKIRRCLLSVSHMNGMAV